MFSRRKFIPLEDIKEDAVYTDKERLDFLDALDERENEIRTTEWESYFISNTLYRTCLDKASRVVVDRLIEKYKHRIKQKEK